MCIESAHAVARVQLCTERLVLLQNVEYIAQHLEADGVFRSYNRSAARVEAHAGHLAEQIAGMQLRNRMVIFEIHRRVDVDVLARGILFFPLMFLAWLQLAGELA